MESSSDFTRPGEPGKSEPKVANGVEHLRAAESMHAVDA